MSGPVSCAPSLVPSLIAFEEFYSDASGVQFAVRFAGDEIEFEAVERIQFPRDRLDWLIHCLTYIKTAVEANPLPQPGQKQ